MKIGIAIGDRVRYEYTFGVVRGEIVDISLELDENNKLVTWIKVMRIQNNKEVIRRIRASASRLKKLKFKVLFRDNYRCAA